MNTFYKNSLTIFKSRRGIMLSLVFLFMVSYGISQPLSGTYTVCPSGCNYASPVAAASAVSSRGINGPVTFTIGAGTYTGQVVINTVSGVSATNTITFDGGAGNAATRILTFAATSTTDAWVIHLNGSSFINFRNLTIRNTGTAAGSGVQMTGAVNNCRVAQCSVLVNTTSTGTGFRCININNNVDVTSGSTCGGTTAAAWNIYIDSNVLDGAHTSIFATSSYSETNRQYLLFVRNNRMDNIYAYGILTPNLRGYQIHNNFIRLRGTFSGYGFGHCNGSTTGSQTYELIGNTIVNPGNMGVYYQTPNNNGARAKVINNFVTGTFLTTGARGIQLNYIRNVDFWHNTVIMDYPITTGTALFVGIANYPCDLRNNNLLVPHTGATGWCATVDAGSADFMDYNNYYKAAGGNIISVFGTAYNGSNFKGGQGLNQNSLAENPFVISNNDPRPQNPCFKGINLGVTNDINNAARTNPPTIGAAEAVGGLNWDAKVEAFISPGFPVIAGAQDIVVRIKNNGQNTINSLNVSVQLGTTTRTINWTGTLATCGMADVTFTGSNQLTLNNGANLLRTWVDSPNGNTDQNRSNDTLEKTFCTALPGGTYTINGANPTSGTNFRTFNDAVSIMQCGGIGGPIVFNVAAGTYNEQVDIPEIPGASATNTITFEGTNRTNRILTGAGTMGNYVLRLNGADYIRVRNLTIRATSTSNGFAVHLTGKADYNIVENCNIHSPTGVSSTNLIPIGIMGATYNAGGDHGNYNMIRNNFIEGGYLGVVLHGTSTSVFCLGNELDNNDIATHVYYGVFAYYQDGFKMTRNKVRNMTNTSGYSIYFYYVRNFQVDYNLVRNNNYMTFYLSGCNISGTGRSRIMSNILGGNFTSATTYTLYMASCQNIDVWSNSVYNNSSSGYGIYITSGAGNALLNNIVTKTTPNGYVLYVTATSALSNSDWNLFFDYGSGTNYTFYGTAYTNLASIKQSTPYEANTIHQNPNFASLANQAEDLHLATNQPAPRGARIPVMLFDVDGDPRCDIAPSIGADESGYFTRPPVASFAVPDTIYNGSVTRFINTTLGDPRETQFSWLVDGTNAGNSFHLEQSFFTNTTYSVSLTARNCSSVDTLTKTFVVRDPTSRTISDFTADRNVVDLFESVNFVDQSRFGPTGWEWSASPASGAFFDNSSAASPNALFFEPGYYEICLSTENKFGKGKDTCKSDYILVRDLGSMCNQFSSTAVAGRLADDGGLQGNYNNSRSCSYLIEPCATSVTLKFNYFLVADNGDMLRVYDGVNNAGTLLGTFTLGSGLPGGVNGLRANSGKMYIEWITNGAGIAPGFDAVWSSTPDTSNLPHANFTFPAKNYTGKVLNFTSTSTGQGLSYRWDFDPPFNVPGLDGGFLPTDRYAFPVAGTYPVRLEVRNCGGVSSITKNVRVDDPSGAPIVGFTADRIRIPVQGSVTFTDTSLEGPYAWKWKVSNPQNVIFENNDDRSPKAKVYFFRPGFYTVTLIAENDLGIDSAVKTNYIEVFDLCKPSAAFINSDIGISRVQFGNIDNSSAIGLTDYTSYVNTFGHERLIKGTSFNIRLERNTVQDNMSRKVWIDWNLDGDFDDAGEEVAIEAPARTKTFSATIQIPTTAVNGYSVLRVGTSYANGNNSPCGINPVGEFEDYPIEIINDNILPVITLNGADTVSIEQWYSYAEAGFTANDNLDGNITGQVVVSGTVDSSVVGTYVLLYNVTDGAGNAAITKTRVVLVTGDVTPPVITLIGQATEIHNVFTNYIDQGANAIDYFNRDISGSIITTGAVNTAIPGRYIVNYSVTDGGNNTVAIDREVIIADLEAPIITLNTPDTVFVEVGSPYIEPGFNAADNFDPSVTVNIVPGTVNTNITGTTILTYSTEDAAGNVSIARKRVVIVRDTEAPVLSLIGLDTVFVDVFGDYIEEGASVADNYCVQANKLRVSAYPNVNVIGDYIISYNITDCEGNVAASITRLVKVVDRKAPVLTLNGVARYTYHVRWSTYNDAGVSITDNYYPESTLQPLVQVTTNFQSGALEGDYDYCYDLTDPSGNRSNRVCRTIRVVENTTGLVTIDGAQIIAYPNPTRGVLNIEFNTADHALATLKIMDATGRVIRQSAIDGGMQTGSVDLSTEASGLYLLSIEMNGNTQTIRIALNK